MDYQSFITRALGEGINVLDFESFEYPAVANFLKRAPEFSEAVKAVKILEISGSDLLVMPRERYEKTLNLSGDIAHHLAEIIDKVRSLGAILKPLKSSSVKSSTLSAETTSGSATSVVKRHKRGKSSRSKSTSTGEDLRLDGPSSRSEKTSSVSAAVVKRDKTSRDVKLSSAPSVVVTTASASTTTPKTHAAVSSSTSSSKVKGSSSSTSSNKGLALIKSAASASASAGAGANASANGNANARAKDGKSVDKGAAADVVGGDYLSFDPCIGIEAAANLVSGSSDVDKRTPLKRRPSSSGVVTTTANTSTSASAPLVATGSKSSTALDSAPLASATTTSTVVVSASKATVTSAGRGSSGPRRNPIAKPSKTATTTVNRSVWKRKHQSSASASVSSGGNGKQVPILSYTGKRDFNIVDRCIKASIYFPIKGCYFDFTNVVEGDVELTHLVAAICIQRPTLKILYALARGAYILTPSFVYQAEEEEKWPVESEHEHPKWPLRRNRLHIPQMMQGLIFFLYGRFRKFNHADMVALIELCGGTCVEDMNSCTHVIVKQGASLSLATSLEIPRNVVIVTEDWITASIEAGNVQVPPDFVQPSQSSSRPADSSTSTLVKHSAKNVTNARLSACSTIDSLDASVYMT